MRSVWFKCLHQLAISLQKAEGYAATSSLRHQPNLHMANLDQISTHLPRYLREYARHPPRTSFSLKPV